jgi:hypothetical protein
MIRERWGFALKEVFAEPAPLEIIAGGHSKTPQLTAPALKSNPVSDFGLPKRYPCA